MKDLIEALRNKNMILFVGAGLSMNLGLPSWSDLIRRIANELDFDEDVFNTFGADYLQLAEYYKIKKNNLGSLRSWMDRTWHNPSIDISKSILHKYILELDFPIIYTTNYDRWIENAYDYYGKKYKKIKDVSDLVNLSTETTQIIKFHGDFEGDDNSIVLTETSYFERLEFETPLDIKLRADILGKSILFIGYSLNDINLRYLFFKLNKLWQNSQYSLSQPKSHIFLPSYNPIQEAVLEKRGIISHFSDEDDEYTGLLNFLEKIRADL